MKLKSLVTFTILLSLVLYGIPFMKPYITNNLLLAVMIGAIMGGIEYVVRRINYLNQTDAPMWLCNLVFIGIPAACVYFS